MGDLEVIKYGTVKFKDYIFWIHVEIVEPYVKKYLHEKFPDSLIVPELNRIDYTVLKEELPVEIQSTKVDKRETGVKHSDFEESIRKQIEDNIENYGKCWFFFDSEYYRYLNDIEKGSISLNLDWLAKYVKEDKLMVFTVRYDGLIKELKYEDLGFIRKLSSICKMEYEDDDRILNRNKIKIMNRALDSYKFTQDEIDRFCDDFKKKENKKHGFGLVKFLRSEGNDRAKFYSYILDALGNLIGINKFLDMNKDFEHGGKNYAQYLGIVENYGIGTGTITKFVDKFNICQYFPGYLRHKEWWDVWGKQGLQKDNQGWRELFLSFHDKKQRKLSECM